MNEAIKRETTQAPDDLFSAGTIRHRVYREVDPLPTESIGLEPGVVVSRHQVTFDISEMLQDSLPDFGNE